MPTFTSPLYQSHDVLTVTANGIQQLSQLIEILRSSPVTSTAYSDSLDNLRLMASSYHLYIPEYMDVPC